MSKPIVPTTTDDGGSNEDDNRSGSRLLQQIELLLDWSDKQRRILTANGTAESLYTAERGFDFDETELPHYHLMDGGTRSVFEQWKQRHRQQQQQEEEGESPIVGAWTRTLFYGGWEHSCDKEEYSFNLQSNTLFIDLRIPILRDQLLHSKKQYVQSLEDMTDADDLRMYARQHVFAGYSRVLETNEQASSAEKDDTATTKTNSNLNNNKCRKALYDYACTRHHCIDWNFVGMGRTRPNKWWIEANEDDKSMWKEWAYATNDQQQHYYCEHWKSLLLTSSPQAQPVVLVLRKASGRDGILIVIGDHFNYCLDREVSSQVENDGKNEKFSGLVQLVDASLAQNDLVTARSWLSMQGGHGRISTQEGWLLDHCIEFWKEGTKLWTKEQVQVQAEEEESCVENCKVVWNEDEWLVFESRGLTTAQDLEKLLHEGSSSANSKIILSFRMIR